MTKNDPTRNRNANAQIQNQKPPEIEKNAMEEKVTNLTSLNRVLVKNVTEKKQEIETLVSEKEELRSELARSGSERVELRDELGKVSDENLVLEIESDLVRVYVADRFKELGLDVARLVKEKDDREDEIRVLIGEKNELFEEIDSLKSEFDLEVSALRRFIKELEGYLADSLKEEKAMKAEIDALAKQKTFKESELNKVKEEMDSLKSEFDLQSEEVNRLKECVEEDEGRLLKERDDHKTIIEVYKQDQTLLLNAQSKRVEEIEELNKKMESAEIWMKEANALQSRVKELSNALAQAELKKEEAEKALGVELYLGKAGLAMVSLSQKSLDETKEELKKVKTERERLSTEKNALASQSESLKREKAVLENDLVKLGKAKDALEKELEAVKRVADRSLVMLKSTVSSQSQPESGVIGTESYEAELESIERDLKNREEMIAEMRREAQQAHKQKNIWTLVSSLTTISAAVSFFHARTR